MLILSVAAWTEADGLQVNRVLDQCSLNDCSAYGPKPPTCQSQHKCHGQQSLHELSNETGMCKKPLAIWALLMLNMPQLPHHADSSHQQEEAVWRGGASLAPCRR